MEGLQTFNDALGKVSGGQSPFFSGGEELGFVDLMFAPLICWFPAVEAAGKFRLSFDEKYPHLDAWLAAFRKSTVASLLPEPEKIIEFSNNFIKKRAVA
jgi:glutathione S-transferase